jgi:hypothetical protein
MIKAWSRLKIAFLLALLFGIHTTALSFHEAHHSAISTETKAAQSISAASDDCTQCAAQHTQVVSASVQLEPSKTSCLPPSQIWIPSNCLVLVYRALSQSRAPPIV